MMKALIPALFLALTAASQAEAATLCQTKEETAFPLRQVSFVWGEALPDAGGSPFFRNWSQKVIVTLSGPRYFQSYDAVAFHSSHSTRLGDQRSTSVKLNESDRISLQEYPEMFGSGRSKLKAAFLVLDEGKPGQKTIQLDCH
jgi:hypothetical protein